MAEGARLATPAALGIRLTRDHATQGALRPCFARSAPIPGASGQGLGLTVDEVIHHDEVTCLPVTPPSSTSPLVIRTRKTSSPSSKATPRNERVSLTLGRRHEGAVQEAAVDVEILDLRAVIVLHVSEDGAEP